MGRIASFRENINDLSKLDLRFIKNMNLQAGPNQTNPIWKRGGKWIGSVLITVWLHPLQQNVGLAELYYEFGGEPVQYLVELVLLPSNLGKRGGIWYFICPHTKKRCRSLYLYGKYFVSRYVLKGMLYEKQTWSRQYRSQIEKYYIEAKLDEASEAFYKPYAKSHYRGNPTPKARKVLALEKITCL